MRVGKYVSSQVIIVRKELRKIPASPNHHRVDCAEVLSNKSSKLLKPFRPPAEANDCSGAFLAASSSASKRLPGWWRKSAAHENENAHTRSLQTHRSQLRTPGDKLSFPHSQRLSDMFNLQKTPRDNANFQSKTSLEILAVTQSLLPICKETHDA